MYLSVDEISIFASCTQIFLNLQGCFRLAVFICLLSFSWLFIIKHLRICEICTTVLHIKWYVFMHCQFPPPVTHTHALRISLSLAPCWFWPKVQLIIQFLAPIRLGVFTKQAAQWPLRTFRRVEPAQVQHLFSWLWPTLGPWTGPRPFFHIKDWFGTTSLPGKLSRNASNILMMGLPRPDCCAFVECRSKHRISSLPIKQAAFGTMSWVSKTNKLRS